MRAVKLTLRSAALCGAVLFLGSVGSLAARGEPQHWEQAGRQLAGVGLRYGQSWVPPGETSAWKMDCSNAARWMVREVLGRELPRTASSQYTVLRQEGKFRRMRPDDSRLAKVLRPGDLLFWEHTYKPTRKPPVTHVMVYLGKDAAGQMMMVGAQGSRGVGIYRFLPKQVLGSYRWFLWFRRDGRFIGFARP